MPQQEVQELHDAARSALASSDLRSLEATARELIALAQSLGDRRQLGFGYHYLGSSYLWRNDGQRAEEAYRKSLEIFSDLKDPEGIARSTIGLASTAMHTDLNAAEARRLYEEALPAVRQAGDRKLLAATLGKLGETCQLEADYDASLRYANEAMAIFEELALPQSVGLQLVNLAHLYTLRHDYAQAFDSLHRAHGYVRQDSNPRRIAWYLEMCFTLAAARGEWELAARILGFVNRYRSERNVPRLGLLPWFTTNIERMSANLDESRVAELAIEGEQLTLDEIQKSVDCSGLRST